MVVWDQVCCTAPLRVEADEHPVISGEACYLGVFSQVSWKPTCLLSNPQWRSRLFFFSASHTHPDSNITCQLQNIPIPPVLTLRLTARSGRNSLGWLRAQAERVAAGEDRSCCWRELICSWSLCVCNVTACCLRSHERLSWFTSHPFSGLTNMLGRRGFAVVYLHVIVGTPPSLRWDGVGAFSHRQSKQTVHTLTYF